MEILVKWNQKVGVFVQFLAISDDTILASHQSWVCICFIKCGSLTPSLTMAAFTMWNLQILFLSLGYVLIIKWQ